MPAVYGGDALIRKSAKEVLAESFREVAERKAIDKITVKDITENCGYSPATFYRQFKDEYDLIAWDYTRELKAILSEMDGSKTEWQNTLTRIASFFQERKVCRSYRRTPQFPQCEDIRLRGRIESRRAQALFQRGPCGVCRRPVRKL